MFDLLLFGVGGGLLGLLAVVLGLARVGRSKVDGAIVQRQKLAGLPDDPELRAEALRRQLVRHDATSRGGAAGAAVGLIGLVVLVLLDFPEGGFYGLWISALFGYLGGFWWGHRRAMLPAGPGDEPGIVATDRLVDHLRPIEVRLHMWQLVVALFLCVAGAVAIAAGGQDRSIGIALTAIGAVYLLIVGVLVRVVGTVIRTRRAATSEAGLRWDDADRADQLRGLLTVSASISMILIVKAPGLLTDLSGQYPRWLLYAAIPLIAGSYAAVFLLLYLSTRRVAGQPRPSREAAS